ncbi:MAG TPA: hypothetical protein VIL74_24925 [Pyrinomonadaceae bacterium]|jgi:hypothetical protein
MEKILLLLNITATLFLTGVVWTVQLVQYPFFSRFESENFTKYHDEYRFWITPIVAPPMIVEIISAVLLVVFPPDRIDPKLFWLGLVLTLIVWVSTFLAQVPLHEKLARGFDARAHSRLVHSNWLRTVAWSLRGGLVFYFAWKAIRF